MWGNCVSNSETCLGEVQGMWGIVIWEKVFIEDEKVLSLSLSLSVPFLLLLKIASFSQDLLVMCHSHLGSLIYLVFYFAIHIVYVFSLSLCLRPHFNQSFTLQQLSCQKSSSSWEFSRVTDLELFNCIDLTSYRGQRSLRLQYFLKKWKEAKLSNYPETTLLNTADGRFLMDLILFINEVDFIVSVNK